MKLEAQQSLLAAEPEEDANFQVYVRIKPLIKPDPAHTGKFTPRSQDTKSILRSIQMQNPAYQ